MNAFSGAQKNAVTPADTAVLKITLQKVLLNNIRLKFSDKYAGNEFTTSITNAEADLHLFQPDRLQFGIDKLTASGLRFFMVTTKEALKTGNMAKSAVELLFKANKIDLKDINVSYQNKVNGMFYANTINHLAINKTDLDLAKENVLIGAIFLDSSFIQFTAPKIDTKLLADTLTSGNNWNIAINQLQLKNDAITFDDNNFLPKEGFDYAHIGLKKINISAGKIFYSADSILANINQLAFRDKSGFSLDTTHANIRYSNKGIEATDLYIKTPQSLIQHTLVVKYDDIKKLTDNPQNSEVRVQLKNSTLAINDLYMLMPSVKKYLPPQKFKNNIIRLSTQINGTLKQLNIPSLQLAGLSGTVINAKAVLYNVTDTNNFAYDITIFNSSLPRMDLLKFMPANNELLDKLPPVINFATHLKGNLKNTMADITINSSSFLLSGKGEIKNIDKPNALQYNIAIADSRIEKSLITALFPPGTIPASIDLPEIITLTGTAKGNMTNIQTDLTLGGTYGGAKVKGFVYNFKNPSLAAYDLTFATQNFQVGKLIKQDTIIGNITFSGYAKGKGFNYKTMNAVIKGNVESIGFKKYDYRNIVVNADLKNGNIVSDGSIDDANIKLNYTATANVKSKYPTIEIRVNVDTIQLQPLHLYKDTLNASFTAYLKAADLDPENLNVYTRIDSSKINVKNKLYAMDSIIAKATTANGINDISLSSPLADVVAKGKFQYNKIGLSLMRYIDRYYNVTDTVIGKIAPQQITFEGVIKKNTIITGFVEGVDYDNIVFNGSYASNERDSALQLKANIPYLLYQTNKVSNGVIDIASLNNQITGTVNFDTLHVGSNKFYKTAIVTTVAGDSVSIAAVTKDQKENDRFAVGADITRKDKAYTFSLKDTLLLNYKKWTVAPDNKIMYSPKGILVTNFLLSNDSTSIAAASRENVLNSTIDVTINNLKIKDITSMLNSDTLLASGIIDGKFSISEFDKKLPAFTGNLRVDSLQFMQQPVGTIKLFAEKTGENNITATMGLTGNGNIVDIKGNYYLNNDTKQFDADLNIGNLNMTTLQAFSQGNLVRSSGSIRGKLILDGQFTNPHWNGSVSFDTTRFSIAKLGTTYAIDNQKINFNYPVISFNKFTVKDSANNAMVVDGDITSKSITAYDLNVGINAKNFTLVNVSKAIDNQVYGFAAVDADISITGNSKVPAIEGNITLNDKTNVTLVLPESNVNKDDAKSVVRFIDRDTFALPEKIAFRPVNEVIPAFAQFLNYNLNIEVSKKAALTIIIDPSSGDELKIQGDAQLNAGVDPGGNIVIAGNYALNSGYYILNYQFLRKKFNLLPGSTIAFSGAPTDARIDIRAEYIAKTSPKDLLGNEVGTVDPKLANTFKQEIPFRVILTLKGSMMKPEISFDIQLPDENVQMNSDLRTTIQNKLTQLRGDVAATNKQVFSLLLFNRFVGEQSTDFFKGSGDGGGFNNLARQSVSKFLSSALDNIASDLFRGLDVDLNLKSYKDYSSGDAQQKTDLNVAITKSFINDRISISVGKNFGIEGQDASAKAAQQKGAGFLPDVTVNYKLTQDGKYLLRAYKKTQFEVILDGYVIETGVAFVVTMDYDKFGELFKRKSKE
jgi:translocation and assembly module TamB